MLETSPPVTRFRVAECWFGTMNLVVSPPLMEKVCQLIIEFFVVWVIVSVDPAEAIVELPETTVPPVGLAKIGAVWPSRSKKQRLAAEIRLAKEVE